MADEIPLQRWERRERKKQAARIRMKKSGMSVRLLQQIRFARDQGEQTAWGEASLVWSPAPSS